MAAIKHCDVTWNLWIWACIGLLGNRPHPPFCISVNQSETSHTYKNTYIVLNKEYKYEFIKYIFIFKAGLWLVYSIAEWAWPVIKHYKLINIANCVTATFPQSRSFFTPSPNQNHVNNLLKTCYKSSISNIFIKHKQNCNYKLSNSRWGWSTANKHCNTSLMFSCPKESLINDIFCTVSDSEVPSPCRLFYKSAYDYTTCIFIRK